MLIALLSLFHAHAEGTAELGTTQALQAGTVVYVDIVDPAAESLTWTGTGDLTVLAPDGANLGSLSPGSTLAPTQVGSYQLTVGTEQTTAGWDLTVNQPSASGGRLWSYDWRFNARSFASSAATTGSFYAIVPGGEDQTAVIELKLEGLAGYVYNVSANGSGVDGAGGQSVPASGNTTTPEFPIYLNPPTNADYSAITPQILDFAFAGQGSATDVYGDPLACDLAAGGRPGSFEVWSNTEGTAHIVCDLDEDGLYERTQGRDVLRVGAVTPGANSVPWDGLDGFGDPVGAGSYACAIEIHTGEFHYVGQDIETSYQGMRLYEVQLSGDRRPLSMYWNDQQVQAAAQTMPSGELGLQSSGEDGMFSGAYGDAAVANVNARAWGSFTSGGKGNQSYLDTYTWLEASTPALLPISAADATLDSDGDLLSDYDEQCLYGTDPGNPDSDGDGIDDGAQHGGSTSGGLDGGLESNGDLAEALALRSLYGGGARRGVSGLGWMAPLEGPQQSVASTTTPDDLLAFTEATDVHAVDYFTAEGRRVGALMLIETLGELYPHTKPICDRAAGAALAQPWVEGLTTGEAVHGTLRHPDGTTEDHLTLQLYEVEGGWQVHPSWLLDELPSPLPRQRVVVVQAWASAPGGARDLAEGVLDGLGHITWRQAPAQAPAAWVVEGSTAAGELTLTVANPAGVDGDLVAYVRTEAQTLEVVELGPLQQGSHTLHTELKPFLDLTVDLRVDAQATDRVWLSDGVFVPLGTSMSPCSVHRDLPDLGIAEGQVQRWSGCGAVDAAAGDGVGRHFTHSPDLPGSLYLWTTSSSPQRVCVEDTALGGFACVGAAATPQGGWVAVDRRALQGDAITTMSLVSVTSVEGGQLEVGALVTSEWAVPAEDGGPSAAACGCSATPRASWLAFVMAAVGLTRRRSQREQPAG